MLLEVSGSSWRPKLLFASATLDEEVISPYKIVNCPQLPVRVKEWCATNGPADRFAAALCGICCGCDHFSS